MGFDLHGEKPTTEIGHYFRNNVWYWRPLWSYVCDICDDILNEKDMQAGQFNDGYLITEEKAVAIGKRIDEAIKTGRVAIAKQNYDSSQAQGYAPEQMIRKMLGLPEPEDNKPHYPFEIANVKEFGEFCKTSGGFTIC